MNLSRIYKNTLALFSAQVYNKFTAAIFFAIAARLLGVAEFGKYSLVLTFIALFYIISDWGLSTLTIRDLAREPDRTKEYLIHTVILRSGLAIISYLVLIGIALLLAYPREILVLLSVCGLSIITNNILGAFNAVFSAHEKMYIPSIMGIIFSTIFLITGAFCLYLKLGLISLMIIIVSLSLINTIFTGWLLRRFLWPVKLSFNYVFDKRLLSHATPFAILSALSIIYFRIDTIILSKLDTMEAVGLYNAVYKIVEFLMFIPVSLLGAYFPQMSREARYSINGLKKSYFRSTRLLLIIILPITITCTIFAGDIIQLVFGRAFLPATNVLRVLLWAVVIMYINAPLGNILYNSDRLPRFIPFAILNTLLNIILNFIFIPKWGYIGAGIITLTTEITGFFILIWFLFRS